MIECNLIPKDEISELFILLLEEGYSRDRTLYNVDKIELEVFKQNGYFDLFLSLYFDESHIKRRLSEICYKTNFYMSHLLYLELDIEFVRKTIDLFSELPYPYTLRDRIKDELWEKDDFKNNFETIARHNGIVIPDTFLE